MNSFLIPSLLAFDLVIYVFFDCCYYHATLLKEPPKQAFSFEY